MVKAYLKKIDLSKVKINLNDINNKRKEYLKKLKNDSLKQSYCAWIYLKEIVLKEYLLDIDKLELYYNEHNKPYFKEFNFNISHSKDLILVAISNDDVGVDIQYIDKNKDTLKLQQKLNINDDIYEFYKVFSAKEAISKQKGTGLLLSNFSKIEEVAYQQIISVNNDEYVLSISSNENIELIKDM